MGRVRPVCAYALSVGAAAILLSAACASGAVVGSTAVSVNATPVDKPQAISGQATVTTSQAGSLQVTIDWVDNYNRVADRQVSTITVPGTNSVNYSFPTSVGLTLLNTVRVSASFPATGDTLSTSTASWELVPDPMDHEDYHANVWGSGDTSSANYFASIKQANVDLGHIYRLANFYGPTYNVRPNHDFIENKTWFEMQDSVHDPKYNVYSAALANGTYYTPTARAALVRPQSLSSASGLSSLVSTITPRFQFSRKWRPMQWNIADEFGLGRRDYPFDYDLGPDCIAQFITWLQGQYGTIGALNAQWGTHFNSFSDLSNPINAPRYGEAALIVTQEMADREFPLYNDPTGAKNFSPWSDFRRHMELTMANAMQNAVDAARSVDVTVPIGWEGGETAEALNGYDYWLQLQRMGSFEAYDLNNSPEYARSFRVNKYGERLFRWITMFSSGSATTDRYHLWFDLIHYGQRASIIWSNSEFFSSQSTFTLSSYATGLSPAYQEFRAGLAKLLSQGEQDDGQIAIYYSQRSIQISWMYDNEPKGVTWLPVVASGSHQPSDRNIMTSHYNETGWLKALEDIGLKGRFVSYEQVAGGELISKGYKVLIMPRIFAMSPEEIAAVQAFAQAGGVVIADTQAGIYDGHCKRRSIADGGGLMDSWFGIQRTNYRSTERNARSTDAWSGSVYLQAPPAGFEALTQNLSSPVSSGWHAVEDGVGVGDGTAVGLVNNSSSQPVLIVKNHGAGKSVYMNVTLMRYGRSGGNYTDERRSPSSAAAGAVRQLVRNLVALAGVTPKVRVLQGYNAPDTGADVYNFEKARFIDGPITYLGCVVNSQMETKDWSTDSSVASTLFGQAGVTTANVTLVLDQPANVYDVRQKTFLGYGTRINAQQPVREGGVFALLPYKVNSLRVDSLSFDAKQRATVRVSVRTSNTSPHGRHVLRLTVLDNAGAEVTSLTRSVVAPNGLWQDVIPFAVTDNLTGWRIVLTDMATGVSLYASATRVLFADVDGDGAVNLADLKLLVAAWNSAVGSSHWNVASDFDNDGAVQLEDLKILVANWNSH